MSADTAIFVAIGAVIAVVSAIMGATVPAVAGLAILTGGVMGGGTPYSTRPAPPTGEPSSMSYPQAPQHPPATRSDGLVWKVALGVALGILAVIVLIGVVVFAFAANDVDDTRDTANQAACRTEYQVLRTAVAAWNATETRGPTLSNLLAEGYIETRPEFYELRTGGEVVLSEAGEAKGCPDF